MTTIAENLVALQEAKENIKTAIEGKGVSLEGVPLTEWGSTLAEASIGGGDDTETVKGLVDGTLTEFDNTKVRATSIMPYRFYKFPNLKHVNFIGIEDIPDYTCYNNEALEEIVLDSNTKTIGNYAFNNYSSLNSLTLPDSLLQIGNYAFNDAKTEIILETKNPCKIGTCAFYNSQVLSIKGKLGDIGSSAFAGLSYSPYAPTKTINISIFGNIGSTAFRELRYVEEFVINSDSKVTGSIGSQAFQSVGYYRSNASSKIFSLDFSNSEITSIDTQAFGSTQGYWISYFNIKFPETLTSIGSNAFAYGRNLKIYFNGNPATINSNSFIGCTNLKLFVPYNLIETYRTATNWTSQSNNIYGYAKSNTFTQGETLPLYTNDGYGLTWYSDEDMTIEVTTVDNSDNIYYCLASTTKEAIFIRKLVEDNCIAQVSDLDDNMYTAGEPIPVGTTLKLSVTSITDGYTPYLLTINNTDVQNSTYTTGLEDLTVTAICYDGVNIPAVPGLSNNSWATIKQVVQEGRAHLYWTVGEEKNTTINGTTYAVRLADLQPGRYTYADGVRSTNAAFEIYTLYPTSQAMNPLELTNKGGFGAMSLSKYINNTILAQFSSDLASLLEEVSVPYANGGSSNYNAIVTSAHKLFFQSPREVNVTSTSYSRTGEGTVWDYYINATSTNIKKKTSAGSIQIWWTRSPYPSGSNNFTVINTSGSGQGYSVYSNVYMSFCFAW
jgi:hypothetical protein